MPDSIGLLFACFAVGAMLTASQARRIVRGRDPAQVVFLGFGLAGVSVLVTPLPPHDALVGASLFVTWRRPLWRPVPELPYLLPFRKGPRPGLVL